jgi:pilus assembly protein Flp/PilA
MRNLTLNLYFSIQTFIATEEAQDLVEYCLVVALLALAGVAGMRSLASGVGLAFNGVSSDLATSL